MIVKQINKTQVKYIHPSLNDWQVMNLLPDSTNLEDFGLYVTEKENEICFKKLKPSIATYKDGSKRCWQDDYYFCIPKEVNGKDE
jgi:hypothetical protein